MNSRDVGKLRREYQSIFAIVKSRWFLEGLFYTTLIALIWTAVILNDITNGEPSKLNILLVAWSAYALVSFVLFQATKSGTVINPTKWIRIYCILVFFLLLVCNFVWLHRAVVRTILPDQYDNVRFDGYAVVLAKAGMNPNSIISQNYTGTIWYAGFIYFIFGVNKFYVVLFNGALSFCTWIMVASTMKNIEGDPQRWQWLRFGMLVPDFILHFTSVSKEPLSAFVVACGVWMIAMCMSQKWKLPKLILYLISILLLGFVVRAATSVIVIIVALIWLWRSTGIKGKIGIITMLCIILFIGQPLSDYLVKISGSSYHNWSSEISWLMDTNLRKRNFVDYSTTSGSWNAITESVPWYLIPVVAPVKGFFIMIAPMPIWNLSFTEIMANITSKLTESWLLYEVLFRKGTAWLFIFSMPLLLAAFFDVYKSNRRLWLMTSFTFMILVYFMGFSVFGMIESRYRPMILPFWLSACGAGYHYGRPRRYIILCIYILILGAIIYIIPKVA